MGTTSTIEREAVKKPPFGEVRRGASRIEIVLAYRQSLVRSGLRMLLNAVSDFAVVAEAADVQGARACVRAHEPNVLVLDLDQPTGSALAAISEMVEESPATRVVVMSTRHDDPFVKAAIAAGAMGYVANAETAGELMNAIRQAASATPTAAPIRWATMTAEPTPAGPCDLSAREAEVLGLIAVGYTNAEIAERLTLSVRTVETHRSHIRDKLERPSRAELVEYAFAHGFHQPNQ